MSKDISKFEEEFQKGYKEVSIMLYGNFKGFSRKFHVNFIELPRCVNPIRSSVSEWRESPPHKMGYFSLIFAF